MSVDSSCAYSDLVPRYFEEFRAARLAGSSVLFPSLDSRCHIPTFDAGMVVRRKARRHRERLGCMLGDSRFTGAAAIFTLTVRDDVLALGYAEYRALVKSRLTAFSARLRRAGFTCRITAKENGSLRGRPHHHVVVDLSGSGDGSFQGFLGAGAGVWRGFGSFRRSFVVDDRGLRPLWSYNRWVSNGCKGRKKGRTTDELCLSRFIMQSWGLGYVDVQEVSGVGAVGYVISYVSKGSRHGVSVTESGVRKGGVRVSYARCVSRLWAYRAKVLVYAHDGVCTHYPTWPVALRNAMVERLNLNAFGRCFRGLLDSFQVGVAHLNIDRVRLGVGHWQRHLWQMAQDLFNLRRRDHATLMLDGFTAADSLTTAVWSPVFDVHTLATLALEIVSGNGALVY